MLRRPPISTLFPSTPLFRSEWSGVEEPVEPLREGLRGDGGRRGREQEQGGEAAVHATRAGKGRGPKGAAVAWGGERQIDLRCGVNRTSGHRPSAGGVPNGSRPDRARAGGVGARRRRAASGPGGRGGVGGSPAPLHGEAVLRAL